VQGARKSLIPKTWYAVLGSNQRRKDYETDSTLESTLSINHLRCLPPCFPSTARHNPVTADSERGTTAAQSPKRRGVTVLTTLERFHELPESLALVVGDEPTQRLEVRQVVDAVRRRLTRTF